MKQWHGRVEPIVRSLAHMSHDVEMLKHDVVTQRYSYLDFEVAQVEQFRNRVETVFYGLRDIQALILPPRERIIIVPSRPRTEPEIEEPPSIPGVEQPTRLLLCWYPNHWVFPGNAVQCEVCERSYCRQHGLPSCLICGGSLS